MYVFLGGSKTVTWLTYLVDDESYRVTKKMAENGHLGEIHAVEASCLDPQDKNGTASIV